MNEKRCKKCGLTDKEVNFQKITYDRYPHKVYYSGVCNPCRRLRYLNTKLSTRQERRENIKSCFDIYFGVVK